MDSLQMIIGMVLAVMAGSYLLIRLLMLMRADEGKKKQPAPPDPLAQDLAAMVPAFKDSRQELQKLLYTAGYYRPSALTEYLAIRATLFVMPLVATALLAFYLSPAQIPLVVLIGALVAGLGFSMPRLGLSMQARNRASRLARQLPLATDVIGLCLTAGQNLIGSLENTSKELVTSCPDMAEELSILHQQARMHSMEHALLQWADRVDVPEIRSLSLLLVQSDRLGTDMVGTLEEVADSQRTLLRQRAEAQANRANFWMLFPTLFCLWIASAIILVGPVYLEFWRYRQEQMNTLLRGARGQVVRSTTNTGLQGENNQGTENPQPRPTTTTRPAAQATRP